MPSSVVSANTGTRRTECTPASARSQRRSGAGRGASCLRPPSLLRHGRTCSTCCAVWIFKAASSARDRAHRRPDLGAAALVRTMVRPCNPRQKTNMASRRTSERSWGGQPDCAIRATRRPTGCAEISFSATWISRSVPGMRARRGGNRRRIRMRGRLSVWCRFDRHALNNLAARAVFARTAGSVTRTEQGAWSSRTWQMCQ